MSVLANACTPYQVPNSNYATAGSLTGTTDSGYDIWCDEGYSGGGWSYCQANGHFFALSCVQPIKILWLYADANGGSTPPESQMYNIFSQMIDFDVRNFFFFVF